MNEEEIRACGGELVAAVRPHVLVGIRHEDMEVAERIFSATTTLLLQVLVDINRIATALERMGFPTDGSDAEGLARPSIYDQPNFNPEDMVLP